MNVTYLHPLKIALAVLVASSLGWVISPLYADDKLNIVASFSILGDMVEQVAGDQANITSIVGPDADAHVYQPSTKDARAVADADVIFVNGFGFETWSESLISEAGTQASTCLELTAKWRGIREKHRPCLVHSLTRTQG